MDIKVFTEMLKQGHATSQDICPQDKRGMVASILHAYRFMYKFQNPNTLCCVNLG